MAPPTSQQLGAPASREQADERLPAMAEALDEEGCGTDIQHLCLHWDPLLPAQRSSQIPQPHPLALPLGDASWCTRPLLHCHAFVFCLLSRGVSWVEDAQFGVNGGIG